MRTITLTLSEDEANSIEVALMIAAIQFVESANDFTADSQKKQESHDLAENFRTVYSRILDQRKEQEKEA